MNPGQERALVTSLHKMATALENINKNLVQIGQNLKTAESQGRFTFNEAGEAVPVTGPVEWDLDLNMSARDAEIYRAAHAHAIKKEDADDAPSTGE